jgi:diguanylate cyclase (GGDEF)-like protein
LAAAAVAIGYLGLAVLWDAWVRAAPGRPWWRRYVPNVTDALAISATLTLAGPLGTVIYPVYLWTIIGNGARFGVASLYLSAGASLVGLATAVAITPFWHDHRLMAAGLLIGLVAVPLYIQRLLKRIHRLNKQLAHELDRANHRAYHDPLTGLVNRRYFIERVEEEIRRSNRHNQPFDLVFIDLDAFKRINDTYGHVTGDRYLREVAERIQTTLRDSDLMSRIGGDEFALLLPGGCCQQVVDRIQDRFQDVFEPGHLDLPLRASFGVSRYPRDGRDFSELLAHADTTMYAIKERPAGSRADRQAHCFQGGKLGRPA